MRPALAKCEGGGSSRWATKGLGGKGCVAQSAIVPDSVAAAPEQPMCLLTCLHTATSEVMGEAANYVFQVGEYKWKEGT